MVKEHSRQARPLVNPLLAALTSFFQSGSCWTTGPLMEEINGFREESFISEVIAKGPLSTSAQI